MTPPVEYYCFYANQQIAVMTQQQQRLAKSELQQM